MKIILNDKYIVSMSALSDIREVEAVGDWNNRKYKVLGEPTNITVVRDEDVVAGESAEQFENENAAAQLKKVQAELDSMKLESEKMKAVERILAEKRGLSRKQVEAWVKTKKYAFELAGATSEDVRKWERLNQ